MSAPSRRCKVCAAKIRRHAVVRSRLIATEACRLAANATISSSARGARPASTSRSSRRDRGQAGGLGLRLADRPHLRLRAGVRYRRRLLRADLARPGAARHALAPLAARPAGGAGLHRRLDLAAGRRGHAGRALWRPRGHAGDLRGHGGHVVAMLQPFEAEHRLRATGSRGKRAHLLGTSGTVTTVAGIHLACRATSATRVDGCWLNVARGAHRDRRPARLTYEERVAQPCIGRSAPTCAGGLRHPRGAAAGSGRASACAWPTAACAKASSPR